MQVQDKCNHDLDQDSLQKAILSMILPSIVQVPGAFHHVTFRGPG